MILCVTLQTLVTFRATDTVWAAKQKLLGTSVLKVNAYAQMRSYAV